MAEPKNLEKKNYRYLVMLFLSELYNGIAYLLLGVELSLDIEDHLFNFSLNIKNS